MKNAVLRYGAFAVAILWGLSFAAFIIAGGQFDFEFGEIFGWVTMLLSLSMVYLGIRAHRLSLPEQTISFGTGFAVGCLISLIATVAWVAGFEIMMSISGMDFMKEYTDFIVTKMTEEGASAAEIAAKQNEMMEYAEMGKNPIVRWLFGAVEILPVGIVVSAVSALIEWKRGK